MNAKEKISAALQASQFSPDQADFLALELYEAVARDLAVKQKAFFGDVSSQGNDGDWHSMSDWLTEVLNSE